MTITPHTRLTANADLVPLVNYAAQLSGPGDEGWGDRFCAILVLLGARLTENSAEAEGWIQAPRPPAHSTRQWRNAWIIPLRKAQSLSPEAQAVLDAWSAGEGGVYLEGDPERLAAALRAVADAVLIKPSVLADEYNTLVRLIDRDIRAIAAELEAYS